MKKETIILLVFLAVIAIWAAYTVGLLKQTNKAITASKT